MEKLPRGCSMWQEILAAILEEESWKRNHWQRAGNCGQALLDFALWQQCPPPLAELLQGAVPRGHPIPAPGVSMWDLRPREV